MNDDGLDVIMHLYRAKISWMPLDRLDNLGKVKKLASLTKNFEITDKRESTYNSGYVMLDMLKNDILAHTPPG